MITNGLVYLWLVVTLNQVDPLYWVITSAVVLTWGLLLLFTRVFVCFGLGFFEHMVHILMSSQY